MTEKYTRKEIIDSQLLKAGWNIHDRTQVIEEFLISTSTEDHHIINEPVIKYRAEFSDYVLLGKDGKPLAVIEAKKSIVDAAIGREQAKQYCYHLQKQSGGELPFCFYTNGHEIYFWDLDNYPPKRVYGFPTRDDLERYAYLRKHRKSLSQEFINIKIAGREYQIRAIRSVMESLEKKRSKFLLIMATGTGKTRTVIALIDALMRGGWIEKVLFLVDRIALQGQALDDFKEYLPNEPRWPQYQETNFATDRRIYVSTYPTILNVIRNENTKISPHFFDLIIVDESHRSIYNTYQEILQYFNTITLGLTATPTDVIDHNTFEIFDCEDGLPTFAYSYEEAVNHIPPYLCDFQVMKIKTKFQVEGINKRTISLEDQKKLILEGKEVAEINYEGTELEKKVINKGTNTLIVREFMEESIKDHNGVLPGKTIFFCISKAHARRIEEIFNSLYPEYAGELAKVIVSDDPRVYGKGGLLDQFKNQDLPRIAISVDMLDTGIDVREITNLVFAKPVYSYTKFWQMIGRGTRLLEPTKIKPWCTEKESFLILDCWDNFEYFKLNPKGKNPTTQVPLPVRLFGLYVDKLAIGLELADTEIVEPTLNKVKKAIADLPLQSIVIRDAITLVERVKEDSFYNELTPGGLGFLQETIRPLFRTISGIDFKAMRFEKDIVEISIAHWQEDKKKFEALKNAIVEEISELPLSVNTVAKHKDLIQQAQTDYYWNTITEKKLSNLVEQLAPLMIYREGTMRMLPAKYNFVDVLLEKERVVFGPQQEAVSIERYKEMVEEKIKILLSDLPVLQKIKNNEPISEIEIEEVTWLLSHESPHITVDLLRKVYNNRNAALVQFIKHILGIEILEDFPTTITKAFDTFIANQSDLSVKQLDFLRLLQTFLIEKGRVERKDLISAPFTRIHPNGIRGVFDGKRMEEILQFINALAA
ncbi:type I restriction endonuclease subunit R [Pedobacter alluvionis]|uniref:DEAD/DEAH box helicase n=1 Tax=Pedobacter alluvionis TaxID=475253 RepID=A0A497XWU1_9SPHI|nr:DEAD/DEAH box helicase family protein [Pedobacter alluvionis]RLJ74660.1 type I restriction enzyme R subunit [Pedobacter alluvionis]TFB29805.1 DEAD/DEAH box helicase [Pedobacter alluvionis]